MTESESVLESVVGRYSVKKDAPKKISKFIGKQLCWNLKVVGPKASLSLYFY